MPNLCSNTLIVSGPAEDIQRLYQGWSPKPSKYGEVSSLLKHYIPMPAIFMKYDELNLETDTAGSGLGSKQMLKCRLNPESEWADRQYEPVIEKELQDILAQTDGFVYWYNWCTKFWGTKWGDYDGYTEYEPGDSILLYDHTSA